jgi:hypothetical protein
MNQSVNIVYCFVLLSPRRWPLIAITCLCVTVLFCFVRMLVYKRYKQTARSELYIVCHYVFRHMGVSFLSVPRQSTSDLGRLMVQLSRSHHPRACPQQDPNARSQQSSACRFAPLTTQQLLQHIYRELADSYSLHVFICGLFIDAVSGYVYEARLLNGKM